MTMQILKAHDQTGWVTALIEGRWVQAKVYNKPSDYGINGSRVSKLVISKTATRNPNKDFLEQMCFNYDRGLDYDEAPTGMVDKIVAELETLPQIFNE